MEYFFDHLPEITKEMQGKKLLIFFDFDLTLSPLALNPKDAFLPENTRESLRVLSESVPVSIISGRDLSDLYARVHLPELNYAGNHGLEWSINGKKNALVVPTESLAPIIKQLQALTVRFPGTIFEQKTYTVALHYRMIKKQDIAVLEEELHKFSADHMRIRWSKKTFDVSPPVSWDKGSVCRAIIHDLKAETRLPLYIGDDITDEDAFRDLAFGITIRIGKNAKSKAKYYLKNQQEITKLLEWLLEWVWKKNH